MEHNLLLIEEEKKEFYLFFFIIFSLFINLHEFFFVDDRMFQVRHGQAYSLQLSVNCVVLDRTSETNLLGYF